MSFDCIRSKAAPRILSACCCLSLAACAADSDAPNQPDSGVARSDAGGSELDRFSFFVTSYIALQALSGTEAGFGGDLRYGETGAGAGLRGADKICGEIAERSLPGAAKKQWRAFLSASAGEGGKQVDAIDRIGNGPWYDRRGRLFAQSIADLLHDRPEGIDSAIQHDFPNEDGVPNQRPDPQQAAVDNHDILTGSNTQGRLYNADATCLDWTSALGDPSVEGKPRVGHSWDRMEADVPVVPQVRMQGGPDGGLHFMTSDGGMPPDGGFVVMGGPGVGMPPPGGPMMFGQGPMGMNGPGEQSWMSILDEAGCAAGVNLIQDGPPNERVPTVGSGGGYGGFYCFALTP